MEDFKDWFLEKINKSEDELKDVYQELEYCIDCECLDSEIYNWNRWNHDVSKIVQVGNRYFEVYASIANTEYQEDEYFEQPIEVEPRKVTVIQYFDKGKNRND